jgi:hypothetical protein
MSAGDRAGGINDILDRGWFEGPEECARILQALIECDCAEGRGFGRPWPLLETAGWTIAPALPLRLGPERETVIDGEYWRAGTTIWREAVGVEAPYLSVGEGPAELDPPFEILWFGSNERFTVRSGLLEVEDLFGTLHVPAERGLLERLLVRGKRVDSAILDSIDTSDHGGPQTVEVRRPSVLVANDSWRDPAALLAARTDVEDARFAVGGLVVRDVRGAEATFSVDKSEKGWRLTLEGGDFAFTELRLTRSMDVTSLKATLDPRIDGLAPGARGRLIFDLRSDLVSLS